MTEYLSMGGYAGFVWSSYALAAVILIVNYVVPRQREKRLLQRLVRRARRESE